MRRGSDAAPKLKHLPFFELLAKDEAREPDARHATAGLLMLRLLDHWEIAGSPMVAPESVSVRSLRAAIMALPAGDAVRECLLGIVNAVQTLQVADSAPVLPRLQAYASLLERRAEHALAADVYASIAERASETTDGDLLIDARLRIGFCERTLGHFSEAEDAYQTAGTIARRRGDVERVLRSRTGLANVASQRGNLPLAESLFEQIVREGAERELPGLQAGAMHALATITYKRGFPARAVRMADEALQLTTDPVERERLLVTIGALLTALGRFTAARDALMVTELTARTEEARSSARVMLLTIAARVGDRAEFEEGLARVEGRALNAETEANFLIESARGWHRFGESERASDVLERGRRFAESHGLSRSIFEIDAMAEELEREASVARGEEGADATVSGTLPGVELRMRRLAAALTETPGA